MRQPAANLAPPPTEDGLGQAGTPSHAAPPNQTADAGSAPPGALATVHQQGDVHPPKQEPANVSQTASGVVLAPVPPKRQRKKIAETVVGSAEAERKASASASKAGDGEPIDAGTAASPIKPKRTRRVGEPKPRRYPVGEHEAKESK